MLTRRPLLCAALMLAVVPPAAAENGSSWSSVLADFFLGPETREEFRWSSALKSGATVEVKGVNGSVHAEAARGRDVSVIAVKKGRRYAPKDVEVKVVEHAGGITVCAVYPSAGGPANECLPGAGGRMNVRNNDVSVEFTVQVPDDVGFVARTVNGSVEVAGLKGDAEAHTVNGSVRLQAAGQGRADTVNGSIRAVLGRTGKQPAAFRTVNGSIALSLPADASASIRAQTVNGSISSEFPLASTRRLTRRELSGTIGSGGEELELHTVNGSIRLHRAP